MPASGLTSAASALFELCESSRMGERAPLSDMPAFFGAYICASGFARFCVERRSHSAASCLLFININKRLWKSGHFCVATETVEVVQSNHAVSFVQLDAQSFAVLL